MFWDIFLEVNDKMAHIRVSEVFKHRDYKVLSYHFIAINYEIESQTKNTTIQSV